jgi:hypothetical protein
MWKQTLALICVVLLAIGLVFVVSWKYASGATHEFCPQTLECRSCGEILLWGTKHVLYRSRPQTFSYPLVDFLIETGHWAPIQGEQRWLVTSQWNHQWRDGQSGFHRQAAGPRAKEWIAWSREHPEVSNVLWPIVLEWLRSEHASSGIVEELLYQAKRVKSAEELKSLADAILREQDLYSKSR